MKTDSNVRNPSTWTKLVLTTTHILTEVYTF